MLEVSDVFPELPGTETVKWTYSKRALPETDTELILEGWGRFLAVHGKLSQFFVSLS